MPAVRFPLQLSLGAVALLSGLALGCTTKGLPPRSKVVERVDVIGADKVDEGEVKKSVSTSETKRAAGGAFAKIPMLTLVDALTVEYQTFDRYVLQQDLERIRRHYRARGFYEAQVHAARVVATEDKGVRVEIAVEEGLAVLLESVEYELPFDDAALGRALDAERFEAHAAANAALADIVNEYRTEPLEDGEPLPRFDEDRYDVVKRAMLEALTDHGFAYGELTGKASVDVAKRRATVRLEARAGPLCHFGEVRFEGLGEIPEAPVRRALAVERGERYSSAKLTRAEQALADLGVFAATEIRPQLAPEGRPERAEVPLVVVLEPIKLRAIRVGLGAELGSLIEAHGIVGWEDRNLLGGLRHFSAELRPSLVFFPTRLDTLFSQAPTRVVPEAELLLDFVQPGFPEARTNLLVSAGGRIYLPRTTSVPDDVPDDYNIVGYREIEGALGLERRFRPLWLDKSSIYGAGFVKIQFDDPFSYNLDELPEGYARVLIPYLQLLWSWDYRLGEDGEPNADDPRKGVYFGLDLQGAALGDAEDVRIKPELRVYAPLHEYVTVAIRWGTGFLFPFNYGDSLFEPGADPVVRARDLQLLSFRGFFSGGPNSNRGYGFRDVGPHEVLPFLSQRGTSDELAPAGGMGLWELSGELRFPLAEKINGVLFLDASDVVRTLSDFRVTHPHLSPGLGIRVRTPVGMVRFDLGVRVPYLQRAGYRYLEPEEGGPLPGEGEGIPIGLSLAIGEAY